MIKLITTGYSSEDSCEEIFLDDSFNILNRQEILGIKNASFISAKNDDEYFVSEESGEYARIHEINLGRIVKTTDLQTVGIVYLYFLAKSGIIISGSYTLGDILLDDEVKFKVDSAHCVISDDTERFLYVADIKKDRISVFDLVSFSLVDEIILPDKTGPRHLKFYNGFLYLVTEYSNEIYVFSQNSFNGKLSFVSKYSTLLAACDVNNYAAAIDIYDGVLAVSNRGKNVISFFSVLDNGELKGLYELDCCGEWPRDIKFYNGYLFVANERSNEICIFNTNDNDGKLLSRIEKKGVNFIYLTEGDF